MPVTAGTIDATSISARVVARGSWFVGYQVLAEPDNRVAMIVDESGDYLPIDAAYTYEVVDENPPLPMWGKKGKVGH